MNYHILALLLFFCFQTQAQKKQLEITESKIIFKEKEIRTIYIIGGIASTITNEDLAFAKKYSIQYHDFGCLTPTDFEEYEVINAKLFEKLNSEYGLDWQKEVKASAMGFDKWKKR